MQDNTSRQKDILVSLQPMQCSNLQTALKTIIKASIAGHQGEKVYADFLAENKALIPMNFDLELLHRYVRQDNVDRVLISVMDVEMFDTSVLSDLISTLHSWSDRIPFVLFIGISTTTGLSESRFSRATISLLDAHFIETKASGGADDTLFNMYETLQHDSETQTFLGPSVVNVLAELAEAQSTTLGTLARALKYTYMSHFFANPLATLGAQLDADTTWDPALCKAIRNLPSFQNWCESLARSDKAQRQRARQVLASDEALQTEAKEAIRAGREYMHSCLRATQTLRHIYHTKLLLNKTTPWETEADLIASLPDLTKSETFKAIEETMTNQSMTLLSGFLDGKATELDDPRNYYVETGDPSGQGGAAFLRAYVRDRTAVSSSSTSLQQGLSPFRQFLAEAFTITHKSPLSQIVHPRPRHGIERALTRPADYLGCACCAGDDAVADRATTLPPTSLLLHMLNEAGAVINVRDLWDAFRDTLSPPRHPGEESGAEDEEDGGGEGAGAGAGGERQLLALFYRALAELRYLGLVKQSKRKPGVECLQKTAWMGL
jgi:origin recognition complex subunit 3